MKRKLKMTILLLLCLSSSMVAQDSEKSVLCDSVVNLSLKQLSRWDIMNAAKKLTEENNRLDPIIAEAIVYTVSEKMASSLIAESYREFTDSQIREVMCFMETEACHRISSYVIFEELKQLITNEMVKYINSDTSWESDIVPSNNKQLEVLVSKYLKLPANKEMFEEVVQPLMEKLKKEKGVDDLEKLNELKKALQKNFSNYVRVVLENHISQEQLQEVIDFFSQAYMAELKKSVPPMKSILDKVMRDPNDFYQKATKELGNLIAIRDTAAMVRNYISILPYMPISWDNINDELISFGEEKSRNGSGKTIRKGTFNTSLQKQGQKIELEEEGYFINKELHGNGVMKIKQGSTFYQKEEGYFAFGHLYGKGKKTCVSVSNEGWTCNQIINGYFYQGVLNGEMECKELIENITNTTAQDAIHTFSRFGLELVFRVPRQSSSASFTIQVKGIVTNDKLNGKAEVILSNGDYYKGLFMNGYFLDGTARVTNKNGDIYEGEFISGRYEGNGKLTRADGSWDEGIFMFGSFFSGTRRDKRGEIHKIHPQSLR